MDFLKRNSGKIALLAIIAFFTLPFIYGNEEEEDFSPFAVRAGMSYQSNPISKLANKIASFYGFSRPASGMVASSNNADSIKQKVASNHVFSKDDASFDSLPGKGNRNEAKENYEALVASSRNFKNSSINTPRSNFDNQNGNTGNTYSTNYQTNYYGNGASDSGVMQNVSNSPVKGYITINGQNYDVIEDVKGDRYVITPKGYIPYAEVVRRNISEKEFMAAKKRLVGLSDTEILAILQQEKEKQSRSANANSNNYQASAGYRNGTGSNVGGTNYARVSTNDKGFDDEFLSKAYEDLKNMNFKVENGTSSSGGGSSYGAYSGGSRSSSGDETSGSNNDPSSQNGSQTNTGLIPGGISETVQTEARQQISQSVANEQTPKIKPEPEDQIAPDDEGAVENKGEGGTQKESAIGKHWQKIQESARRMKETWTNPPMIDVVSVEGNSKGLQIVENDWNGNGIFIRESDAHLYEKEWKGAIAPQRLGEESGKVIPIKVVKEGFIVVANEQDINNLPPIVNPEPFDNFENKLKQTVQKMNQSLRDMKGVLGNLPQGTKIYINAEKGDRVSYAIMQKIFAPVDNEEGESVEYLIDKLPQGNNDNIIIVDAPIFTPSEFDKCATDFLNKVQEQRDRLGSQDGNQPA